MRKRNKIQVNTLTDRLNYALHLGGNTAMLGAVVAMQNFSEPCLLGGIVATAATTAIEIWHDSKAILDFLPISKEPLVKDPKHSINRKFQNAADVLVKRLHNNSNPDPIVSPYRMRLDEVFACGCGTGEIIISRGFASRATTTEQNAILAHEIAHIKAGHGLQDLVLRLVGRYPSHLLAIDVAVKAASRVFGGGGEVLDLVAGVAAAGVGIFASLLIERSCVRASEYQADRVAAQITSPKSMERGLMATILSQTLPKQKEEFIFDEEITPFDEHPSMSKRIARLQAMTAVP